MIKGEEAIEEAVEILRGHGVVALPTETVYGLAGFATSEKAVRKIYELKNRPADNPCIAHFPNLEVMDRYVKLSESIRGYEKLLKLWPGPLTLILPIRDTKLLAASSNLPYCGVRIPAHPLTLKIIQLVDHPLAMPSANRSGHCSPTTAKHVMDDFGDSLLVLDGGEAVYGIESTVLSLVDKPRILRFGAVPVSVIADCLGAEPELESSQSFIRAPGTKYRHYAPSVPVFYYSSIDQIQDDERKQIGNSNIVLIDKNRDKILKNFYSILREAENSGKPVFFIGQLEQNRFPDYVILDRLQKILRTK